ncbi:hypothetical protein ASD52_04335 [Ensifer sp. Root142]|uniref:hypothetical protein n=1 Tax=Ensifer sp. Root142 TaxID=1736461 RepID=UPI00070C7D0A|nr:hypothetical protein [Ensifer sp. Root142]KQY79050.1 hypothetical protein ASD52_04335 [Ensifer sp. Root142]MDP9632084.1 hypothetical protein [Ensifer adhaerens]
MSERRLFWTCLVALVAVLPLAIAVHAWDSLHEMPLFSGKRDIIVESGVVQPYAGGQWKLADLKRLPGPSDDARVVLAEFESEPKDLAMLAQSACRVRLVDAEGRRFEPLMLTEPIVREMYPEVADRPRCSSLAFANAGNGGTVRMAESFMVPAKASDLSLVVEVLGADDGAMVFKWKRS